MKQLSNLPRSVTTVGDGDLRRTAVCSCLSSRLQKSAVLPGAKCSLSAVAAVCWYLFELIDGVGGRRGEQQKITFSEELRVIPTLLTG